MTDPIDRDTAQRVRNRMSAKGVSRAHVAQATGLSERQLRRRLHAEVSFSMAELARVSEAIGCPLAALTGGPTGEATAA